MKNVTTGVELQLTDTAIDHIVSNMSKSQLTDNLRRTLRELRDMEIDRDAWQARAEALEARVQELEAQLAAQWRPVTEPPPGSEPSDGSSLWLVCWDYDPEAGCRLARYAPFIRMWFMEGDEGQPIDPTHYRVNDLPAPPTPQPPPTEYPPAPEGRGKE